MQDPSFVEMKKGDTSPMNVKLRINHEPRLAPVMLAEDYCYVLQGDQAVREAESDRS